MPSGQDGDKKPPTVDQLQLELNKSNNYLQVLSEALCNKPNASISEMLAAMSEKDD